jgi:hypothetical protein
MTTRLLLMSALIVLLARLASAAAPTKAEAIRPI